MLERLPASRAPRRERPWLGAASVALHAGLVLLAVRATGWSAPAPLIEKEPVTLVYHAPPVSERIVRGAIAASGIHSVDAAQTADAPPVIAPIDIPGGITLDGPAVNIPAPSADFAASGAMGGLDHAAATSTLATDAYDERTVDRVVVPLGAAAAPRYPETLRVAGIEGTVVARFIVDTVGRVQRGSLRVSGVVHPLFVRAVEDALASARYVAAEAGGRRVRQLVEQSFVFRITPR